MSFNLDSTDKKILKYLIKDSRIKVVDIASFIGVTSAAIHQRIAKIKRGGLIKSFTLRLDEKQLGYKTCAFIGLHLDKNSQYRDVVAKLKLIPEIVETHYTTGQYGLFIKLYAKDNDHLMNLLNGQVQKIRGISRSETFISLEESISKNIPLN
ncbi:MAG: Lrp/AsnC ligand binding domain-containing protein [Polaribacter sp.]|nr:Lrp/AsnC ligand binding domain-containing protein [Polaribacter sp.]MDG1810460.1 Lrp/AsnC ligand binding domain-containing protein [Polaribacter sp.]MDG1993902.1 Lrp/AsnC ligand binding domain-containing protein [Polaribacter sp.]